jgi:hydroxyethylthiazole kinase-like uncharacterized protein yjeF
LYEAFFTMTITVSMMRIIELNTVALGIPLIRLMEAAGKSVADITAEYMREKGLDRDSLIVVLMGRGGNGGDSLVASRYLSSLGYNVHIIPAYRPELINHPDTRVNYEIVSRLESIIIHKPGDTSVLGDADVVIDGLLGTGVRGELREPIKSMVIEANNSKAKLKIAIDTPTGLDPDTGEVHGVAFKADVTITFHDVKPGLLKRPDITGKVIVANIGVPQEAYRFVGPGDAIHGIPQRSRDFHKGMGGRVMIIGGSDKYTGAPTLSGLASLAAGSDLAFIVAPEKTRSIIASYSPELITLPYPGDYLNLEVLDIIVKHVEETRPHVIVIGPGIGRRDETLKAINELFKIFLEKNIYMVIDADALRAIRYGETKFRHKAVLTPHRGEFENITGIKLSGEYLRNTEHVVKAAKELEATILLKAPIDIISDGEKTRYNRTGNPYMSIGGTGDVLTGIVASILAKTGDPYRSACIGAYLNGLAGDYLLKNHKHVSPVNIIKVLPEIIFDPLTIHLKTYIGETTR